MQAFNSRAGEGNHASYHIINFVNGVNPVTTVSRCEYHEIVVFCQANFST